MTNTPTAPSEDCYCELIDEIGLEYSTPQVSIDVNTLTAMIKA